MLDSYRIFGENLKSISFDSKKVVNTINSHSYVLAKSDLEFHEALRSSDILLPDGIGIVWAEYFLTGRRLRKIAGYDLFLSLMKEVNWKRGSVFFLGASQATLDRIKQRCSKEYPNVSVAIYSPPFKESFSNEDNTKMCNLVSSFKPDILFVGMTAPKQEKWLHDHLDSLEFTIASCIGAVFDFYGGNVQRPHRLFEKFHLEWLGRLIKEPKRLWKRNLSVPLFLKDLLINILRR
ncbi:WecB/TagA/CpsF family glycosyltransferase [Akkermansiaceae bacterium]|nr:WecB/TagA/CpsF family glycosyltransferase [Akkermansiaceae bacterium]